MKICIEKPKSNPQHLLITELQSQNQELRDMVKRLEDKHPTTMYFTVSV